MERKQVWLEPEDIEVVANMARAKWPGYPTRVLYPEVPAWALAQQMEQEIGEIE